VKTVTIILPASRSEHLLRVFASLEMMNCDRERTRLLVFVDGTPELFLMARDLTEQTKFDRRLCVHGQIPGQRRDFSINTRRRRIAAIHNAIRPLVEPCDYVFLIEDDGIQPPDALSRLLMAHLARPHAGFIEGVELGRWGIPHVGAWLADDVYEPTKLESAMPGRDVEEIDAGGLYCCLTRYERYARHEFKPYEGDAFGPDVEWGLSLRQEGYRNYIDWTVSVEHCKPDGTSVHPQATAPVQMKFSKEHSTWIGSVLASPN
jgi:hypothetical protein